MKQAQMRRLDFWVGATLCWLLTLHRRLRALAGPERLDQPPRKLLFIKLIEQGATVIAYDALKQAVLKLGRENVYFCVFPENRAILDLMEIVPKANVLTVRHERPWELALDLVRLMGRCRREGIDTTIDMEFFARGPAIIAYLLGARIRVGLHRFTSEAPYRGDLMTHRMPYNPYIHTAVAYRLLVDYAFLDPRSHPLLKADLKELKPELPRFVPSPDDQARLRQLLATGIGRPVAGKLILLNPNAGDLLPLRRWPPERFLELARRILARDAAATIAVTGAPSERLQIEEFCRDLPADRVVPLAGKTSLRDLFTLYTIADLLVTNDSGPGHFASMTDINSVVLFGPETPALFGPLGGRNRALWRGLSCSPCVSAINHRLSPCTHGQCMLSISVDEVWAAICQAIGWDEGGLPQEATGSLAGRRAGGSRGGVMGRALEGREYV
jgi:ADP-heptose:LPS heptosyltransferase